MKASLFFKERVPQGEGAFAELVVWRLPQPVAGSLHSFKYRLAYVVNGECVLRYDNEPGKGDHRHIGAFETPYPFSTPARLIEDFWRDVDAWER